ncbi:MAG: ATP phosphoribosyltransferase regulatory subunit [Acidobacteria bacterium]|nr:ATP phosphoribosyltransferase regulatory subunit [Acidobacteriota bacterium]
MLKARTLAPGVQYLKDPDSRIRRATADRLRETFSGWSYQELVLPILDYAQSFHLALGAGAEERMYSFVDRDGSLLALRPDITTLVAKAVAADSPANLPLRFWYGGEVFRYENPKAGQQREFYQAGIELIGSDSLDSEIEVLLILVEALQRCGLESIIIPLGHAEFFNGIVEALNLSEEAGWSLKNLVDHKDSWGIGRMISGLDIPPSKRDFIQELPRLAGGREILDRAEPMIQNPRSRQALERLAAIFEQLSALGAAQHFLIDLAEVRNLDYYTGLIFKVYSKSLGFEIGSGGRYDTLIGKFGNARPAVGFSVGLERLRVALSAEAPREDAVEKQADFQSALQLRRQNRKIRMEQTS